MTNFFKAVIVIPLFAYTICCGQKYSKKGLMIFYRERAAFFEAPSLSMDSLLDSEPTVGIEMPFFANLYQQGIKVAIRTYEMNKKGKTVIIDTTIFYVPVVVSYQKMNSNDHLDTCSLLVIKNDVDKNFKFSCNNSGYSIDDFKVIKGKALNKRRKPHKKKINST